MSTIVIHPGPLKGTVTPPPSKSLAHRVILAASLARGVSQVEGFTPSQDMEATLRCVRALGAKWEQTGERSLRITGIGDALGEREKLPQMDCGESGSTLRFLIPIALAVAGGGIFLGRGRLMERPQEPYEALFVSRGMTWEREADRLTVRGKLTAGEYRLPGHVSSQFFTGLLYALSPVKGESWIIPTTPLESLDYIAMTLDVLEKAGVSISKPGEGEQGFHIQGPLCYRAGQYEVEADWSQAAFWYAANFLGSDVTIQGLNPQSAQGDKRIASFYWNLARPGDVELDVSQCPDLAPPLAAMAAVRKGRARFSHAARLRFKESDRLTSVAKTLSAMGAQVEEGPDSLTICGQKSLAGGCRMDCWGDHRIAMMAAIATTACRAPVELEGSECVQKSYPAFWTEYQRLGGTVDGLVSG